MQNYGSGMRGGGAMRRATKMERYLNKSGVFKPIRDEGAGFGRAPRWRKRYKLTGTSYYLYLMFNETYMITDGKQGMVQNLVEFKKNASAEVQAIMTGLEELTEEIHGSGEE